MKSKLVIGMLAAAGAAAAWWLWRQRRPVPAGIPPTVDGSTINCGEGTFWMRCTAGDPFCAKYPQYAAAGGYCAKQGAVSFAGTWDGPSMLPDPATNPITSPEQLG